MLRGGQERGSVVSGDSSSTVTPRASGVTVLVHCDKPLPSVRNPGPEELRGLAVAYRPLSLTLALPSLNPRFRLMVEARVEG